MRLLLTVLFWWDTTMEIFEKIFTTSNVIAFSALALAVYQGISTRRHNKLSSLPYIFVKRKSVSEFSIVLINEGSGLSIINKIIVRVGDDLLIDELTHSNWKKILEKIDLQQPKNDNNINVTSIETPIYLRPGNSLEMINIKYSEKDIVDNEKLTISSNNIDIEVKYESVYKEKFSTEKN